MSSVVSMSDEQSQSPSPIGTIEYQKSICFHRMRVYELALRLAVLDQSDTALEAQSRQEGYLKAAREALRG